MPNWITNHLTINADEQIVSQILSEIKSDKSDFDFNKIRPIPEELINTTAPTRIISDTEYNINSEKGITESISKSLVDKYGFDNWYDWQTSNWGTKWNASEVHINDNNIFFKTAWSNPFMLMIFFSTKYPQAEFHLRYSDEDFGYNVGEYTLRGGLIIDSVTPESGSEEAYELALEIQGGNEYYTSDMFYELTDESELDYFQRMMIKILYKSGNSVNKDMPLSVLNEYLSLALENENYEFASKVRDIINLKKQN